MEVILFTLIGRATMKYGEVTPCCNKTWGECMVFFRGVWYLYFNANIKYTHTVKIDANEINYDLVEC